MTDNWTGIQQYRPREPFRRFHTRTQRWAAMNVHRRGGKTVATVADLVLSAALSKKQAARFAYIAPFYNQAKDIAWEYAKRLSSDIPGAQFNESELRIDYPSGGRVRLYGADNADRLRGIYLDGVVLDEPADMRESVWETIVRPTLADRGGWAVFIGTPKGHNFFHKIWKLAQGDPDWFTLELKGTESGLLPAAEIEAMRREMTPERFAQEIDVSFEAAIVGAYYGREMQDATEQGRVRDVAVESGLPVHTAWDLGIGDSTAIWFWQSVGAELRVVDYYESHGKPLSHYVAEINARYPNRHSTGAQPVSGGAIYAVGQAWDYVPHDARIRELSSGKSRLQTLIELGCNPRIAPAARLEDGINAVRLTLPRAWFDAERCETGIEALRQYQTEFDEKLKVFKDQPKHDWTSHSADAFRYMCLAYREQAVVPVVLEPRKPMNVGQMTFDELHKLRGRQREGIRV